ncbi:hypothetical protein [Paenibacillus sp. y28]
MNHQNAAGPASKTEKRLAAIEELAFQTGTDCSFGSSYCSWRAAGGGLC